MLINTSFLNIFLGVATFLEAGAAAVPGVGALLVLAIGLFAVISDAIRQAVRERQERERRCKKWKPWCSWGKDLLDHYGFL